MGERATSLFPNLEQLFVRGWAGVLEGVDEFGGPGFRSLLARLQFPPRAVRGSAKRGFSYKFSLGGSVCPKFVTMPLTLLRPRVFFTGDGRDVKPRYTGGFATALV